MPKKKLPQKAEYEFDIAISYSGKDHIFAQSLCDQLQLRKIEVYFGPDRKAEMLGRDLISEISRVYYKISRFCVVILSENYSRSKWTLRELQYALSREHDQDSEYILPLRLDDSPLPDGLLSTRAYENFDIPQASKIAGVIADKLNEQFKKESGHKPERRIGKPVKGVAVTLEQLSRIEQKLLKYPGVQSVSIARQKRSGRSLKSIWSISVVVSRKLPSSELSKRGLLPVEFDGLPVDVVAAGDVRGG